ncbi:hypothetical protein CDEF62S_03207 [Castellaniella defragrans]
MLCLGAQQLHALPLRKRGERGVGGTGDKVDRAFSQCLIGLVNREKEFQRKVHSLFLEDSQLRRGDCGKI